ncbi:MAG: DUF5011 domain-containing protein, partial [Oscillospiraceae bacterium]|nr:DUF5011 domain-containing protein [Oscillospiraceae bacterium]
DTSKAGNYVVTYTVTNTANISSNVTRNVEIVAPATKAVPVKIYGFSPKGKQDEILNFGFDVEVAGDTALSVSSLNKTAVTITILDPSGEEIFRESFSANTTRNFKAAVGNHTAQVLITTANGNTSFGLNITTPGGTSLIFPKAEVTR